MTKAMDSHCITPVGFSGVGDIKRENRIAEGGAKFVKGASVLPLFSWACLGSYVLKCQHFLVLLIQSSF